MTTDLVMLTASAVLCALLFVPYGVAQTFKWGIPISVGNREAPPTLPPWAERGIRAHRNMLENFPHFAALVLVAHLSGAANQATALGASLFFYARVVHAVVYLAGIPWVRTVAFFAGLVGEGIILGQIIRIAAFYEDDPVKPSRDTGGS
jgi:uncharacterized MAPEG superfamily protein